VFNWEVFYDKKVIGTFKDRLLEISINRDSIDYFISPLGSKEEVEQFLNLSLSVKEMTNVWKRDRFFSSVYKSFPGVRILKQPIFECLISFICSQNSHVKRIASNIQEIKTRYGRKICMRNDKTWYAFPTVNELSQASVDILEFIGLGYRAKYIKNAVSKIAENGGEDWLQSLEAKTTEEIREELMKLDGIGPKVADCILLFGFNRFNVVPIDTHMWKIAKMHYGAPGKKALSKQVYKDTAQAFVDSLGEYAGWAHSILFAASLNKAIGKKKNKK
jgi:N-glycosylase/DNA lyase